MTQISHLDEVQGVSEQRTEAYITYGEGAAEFTTQQFAKSVGGVFGFAGKQAMAVGGLR